MNNRYRTVDSSCKALFKEKSSKFYSLLFPVSTEDEAKSVIERVKKEYYDSRHVCFAYVVGQNKEIWRINDAGEPTNTAGKPILGQLTSYDLTNVLLIVVRYFGGTKLGVGGLIKAYKASAQLVLEQAKIVEREVLVRYDITFSYVQLPAILKLIKMVNGTIIVNEQTDNCKMIVEIPLTNELKFNEFLGSNYLSLQKK